MNRSANSSSSEADVVTRLAQIEAAVRALSDREAIRDLIIEYATLLDARELRRYAALFAHDGTWSGAMGTVTGPDAIVEMLERGLVHLDLPAAGTYHLTFNPTVVVDGDRATATSRFCYFTRDADDRPVVSLVGHYDDELVRTPGGWRFSSRRAFGDIPWNLTVAR